MNPLFTHSAKALAAMIREGEVSSSDVVEAHIQRIEEVNPRLNAVVKDRFDAAREEAKKADQFLKNGKSTKLPPLHGVPCTIKECFAFAGLPNTSGLKSRKNFIPDFDATVVSRIKEAGAIPLGVTNVPELCMWMETNNVVYGRTNNPYDQSRIVGGSSGGEGAIIGAGGSPFGLGSDIGGSIRMPAFFNGVFGHKPSGGLVPGTGQHPFAHGKALRYLTTGPLTRRAEDLWPLLSILAGPDAKDDGCERMKLGDPNQVNIADLNVVVVKDNGVISVKADMLKVQLDAAEALRKRGAKVVTHRIPALKKSLDIWMAMLSEAGGPSYSELLGGGKPVSPVFELGKFIIGQSDYTLPSIVLAMTEKFPKYMPERTRRFVEMGEALREELTNLIGPRGVMLYPSYPSAAPKHNKPLFPPFNWQYTGIFNMMEFPVTQVPLGLNHEGLPVGTQVAAAHGNDHLTVAVALELEKALGGWVAPKL
jgi:fatty acid amide hydrolase 2